MYDARDGKLPRHYVSQEGSNEFKGVAGFEYLTGVTYINKMLESPLDWLVVYIDSRDNTQFK